MVYIALALVVELKVRCAYLTMSSSSNISSPSAAQYSLVPTTSSTVTLQKAAVAHSSLKRYIHIHKTQFRCTELAKGDSKHCSIVPYSTLDQRKECTLAVASVGWSTRTCIQNWSLQYLVSTNFVTVWSVRRSAMRQHACTLMTSTCV
jgi:hypothetical protein